MGVVYDAVELALDRRVALKLIGGEAMKDSVYQERFIQESRIAAQVEHPNVVPVYSVGSEDGVAFMAMRLIKGLDLGHKIAELRRLEPEDAAGLICQAAAGLDAIHAAGLIHRDVKPANILLGGEEGREHAYITDFGLAKQVATTTELSKAGQVVGTLEYMAPEQVDQNEVTAAADVYALGCVLYKMLTGVPPFQRDGHPAMMFAHLNDDPPLPSATAGVPPAFDPVIARAMAKKPEDRFPSAGDLGRAALAAAAGRPVTEPERRVTPGDARPGLMMETQEGSTGDLARHYSDREPTPLLDPKQRKRRARRNRLKSLMPLVGGLAVGALVGGAVFFFKSDGGDSARQELANRADEICVEGRTLYNEAARQKPKTTEDASDQTDALIRISQSSNRRLRRLEVPDDIQTRWNTYLALRSAQTEQLRVARDAAARNDPKAYVAAFKRIDSTSVARFQAARDLGLNQCSRNSVSG